MISNRPENYPAEGQDAAQMSCKIYVGNLAWATDENALGSHFTTIGEVKGAVVMRSEGRSRGFGFVTFAAPEQAKRAIDTMYDSELVSPKQIRIVLKTRERPFAVQPRFSLKTAIVDQLPAPGYACCLFLVSRPTACIGYGRRLRVNVANQLTRGAGGPGPTDYPMNGASAQGGYQYPAAPYPGGGAPTYGAYSHPPPPVQAPYMGGGYMNPNTYPGNENGGYNAGAPPNHPMPDGRKGSNQQGGFYQNGGSYPYPQGGGYGY
ncbi:hypothetical protein MJO28_008853 [Puccinia striiformis f. sp. tritici]|uniref:Uncharacterized protein n=1 Tax=Puccinia striiformis f. sp. tritici TaxID=168172 RepID=A0ACC0EC73_9BASI|nr:hypothetical protein MJO28_008853 [Puccinia striiformis f. sp. tritici]